MKNLSRDEMNSSIKDVEEKLNNIMQRAMAVKSNENLNRVNQISFVVENDLYNLNLLKSYISSSFSLANAKSFNDNMKFYLSHISSLESMVSDIEKGIERNEFYVYGSKREPNVPEPNQRGE